MRHNRIAPVQSATTAFGALCNALAPTWQYGRRRVIFEALGRELGCTRNARAKQWVVVLYWIAGRRRPPQWAVDALQAALARRADVGPIEVQPTRLEARAARQRAAHHMNRCRAGIAEPKTKKGASKGALPEKP